VSKKRLSRTIQEVTPVTRYLVSFRSFGGIGPGRCIARPRGKQTADHAGAGDMAAACTRELAGAFSAGLTPSPPELGHRGTGQFADVISNSRSVTHQSASPALSDPTGRQKKSDWPLSGTDRGEQNDQRSPSLQYGRKSVLSLTNSIGCGGEPVQSR
jgi:hypothetical protein